MKKIFLFNIVLFVAGLSYAQTNTENYIQTTNCLDADCIKKAETVQYFDYLGRPKQIVSVKSSPTGKDIVAHVEYDALGRQTKEYLPVPQAGTQNGEIYDSPLSNAPTHYGGEKIYTEKILENSPLERVLQQKQVGNAWADKPVIFGYDLNSLADHVKKYDPITNWNPTEKIYANELPTASEYPAGQLVKNTVTDEDGNSTIEFKDGSGQTVLIRKAVSSSQNADTYYVYNEYKQLAFVIPPLASVSASISGTVLDNLCYQYKYDNKNRLVEKKLPGKGWEYLVYDKQNRLVLSQDANLGSVTNNFAQKGWTFTKYDQFGRVAYTGFFANTATRASMQTAINSMTANAGNNEQRDNTTPIVQDGENIYYTKNAFPTESMTILSVNYYDTYPPLPSEVSIPSAVIGQQVLKQPGQSTTGKNTKTLPLASYVRNVEDKAWTKSYTYYDEKGRVIGSYALNHLGGYTKTESELDFVGLAKQTKVYHKRLNTDTEKVITQTYTYDNQNRLLVQKHKVDNNTEEILAQNEYNELSQLKNKKVGGTNPATPLQSIDYKYNIRGWMTKINDPADLNGKLFGYEMRYNNPNNTSLATGRYNGNIAEVDWRTSNDGVLRRYDYQYDALNRLTNGIYSEPNSSVPQNNFFNETVSYDINGNIMTLKRNSKSIANTAELIDDLTYSYTGNRLNTVTESQPNYRGYPDVSGNTIAYDDNGNMKDQKDKGILEIGYNFLDLPNYIKFDKQYFTRGRWLNVNTNYTYRADGTKLKKVYKYSEDSVFKQKTTEYLDGFQYEVISTSGDPLIKFVSTSEGYFNFENNKYIYNYVDHLGNVRLSFLNNGSGAEVLEENNYYPFGLKHEGYNALMGNPANQYKYNGKELQEFGMYDYGARFYMPDIGRWGVMDAMSEKYRRHSPYNYAVNNPIFFTDPDGNSIQNFFEQDAQNMVRAMQANMSFGSENSGSNQYFSGFDFTQYGADDDGGPDKPVLLMANRNGEKVLDAKKTFLGRLWADLEPREWSDSDGTRYNVDSDGKITGRRPYMGDVPLGPAGAFNVVKSYKSALSLFKGGLTNAGRAVTKHPQYFGFESTEALMKVFRSPSAINKLGASMIKDILRNGVKSTGVGGRYPQGWTTYTLPNGNAASWTVDGIFIGFRGLK